MTTTTITVPETAPDQARAAACVTQARALVVEDQYGLDYAGQMLREGAALKAGIVARLAPAKDAAFKAHRAITALERDLCAPIDAAREIISPKILAYQEAERRRLEAEARAEAERLRAQAEADRLAAAEELDAMGETELACDVLDSPAPSIAPVRVAAPATAGVSVRETWSAEVYDFDAFVSEQKSALLLPNMPKLNALARALGPAGCQMKGVRFVCTKSTSVRQS